MRVFYNQGITSLTFAVAPDVGVREDIAHHYFHQLAIGLVMILCYEIVLGHADMSSQGIHPQ